MIQARGKILSPNRGGATLVTGFLTGRLHCGGTSRFPVHIETGLIAGSTIALLQRRLPVSWQLSRQSSYLRPLNND
jgi:hypothetical protein